MPSDQPLGVTPPLSVNLPTEAEKRVSDALLEELKRQKTFESPAETQKRYDAMNYNSFPLFITRTLANQGP